MSELLRAEGVRVEFDRMVAVRDVDLSLQGGQLVGLVGPNGAGKTTLLRALAGLQPITAGQIELMGTRQDGRGKLTNPNVGFAPDTPPVYEDLTVSEFLGFIARQYDVDPEVRDERIEYWIERLWLAEKRKQKIKTLSRGMRQRVTIARAFLPNPYVIFLDEPAAGLDPAGRVHFRELLVSLVRQQKAIIVSSHILSDMEDYCTHLAIMGHGRILRYGPVREIAEHDAARCRYVVMLADAPAETERILADVPGLGDLRVADHKLEFEFDSDPALASELLRSLIQRGLRVCSFSPVAPDLEDAYLRVGMKQVE